MDPNNRSLFAARNEKKTYILKVPLIIVPDRVPETWVLGFLEGPWRNGFKTS